MLRTVLKKGVPSLHAGRKFLHTRGSDVLLRERIGMYQDTVMNGTGVLCSEKTSVCIHIPTHTLRLFYSKQQQQDPLDYSEPFDGFQTEKNKTVYLNFNKRMGRRIPEDRSPSELYWFVEDQLKVLKSVENACSWSVEPGGQNRLTPMDTVYFANILDVDTYSGEPFFRHLFGKAEFQSVKEKVYLGDFNGYFDWFQKKIVSP